MTALARPHRLRSAAPGPLPRAGVPRDDDHPADHLAAAVRRAVQVGRHIPGFGGGVVHRLPDSWGRRDAAVFSAGWTGMGLIEDINGGVMDRFLAAPCGAARSTPAACSRRGHRDRPDRADRRCWRWCSARIPRWRRRCAPVAARCGAPRVRPSPRCPTASPCSPASAETLIGAVIRRAAAHVPLGGADAAQPRARLDRTVAKFNPVARPRRLNRGDQDAERTRPPPSTGSVPAACRAAGRAGPR